MAAPLINRTLLRLSVKDRKILTISLRCLTSQKSDGTDKEHFESPVKNEETHFGFQSVLEEEKEQKVHEVFSNVAQKYDLMNDVMSGGMHRVWKDIFLKRFSPAPGTKLLDVAGGTGDIALRFLNYVNSPIHSHQEAGLGSDYDLPRDIATGVYVDPAMSSSDSSSSSSSEGDETVNNDSKSFEVQPYKYIQSPDENGSHVTVSDINRNMLEVGKEKLLQMGHNTGISWVEANAESLPFSDGEFDAFTIAFGIRNCTHIQQVLNEAYRVLKPGGRFLCLEFSEVKNPLLRSVYDNYSFQVIPVMGQLVAGDWKSYQYLVESIRRFPNQKDFANMIKAAGFRMVRYENLTFGVVAIHSGFKI